MGKIIVLAAGKGGTGKTVLTAALGERLAARGKQVCLVDACAGLRGLDLCFDLQDKVVFDWLDLIKNDCPMEQALLRCMGEGDKSLSLLPAPQDVLPEEIDISQLFKLLMRLQKRFDYVLLDSPSGIGNLTRSLCAAADEILLTSTPDDAAKRCTERICSLLRENGSNADISLTVLVNQGAAGFRKSSDRLTASSVSAWAAYLDLPLLAYVHLDVAIADMDVRKKAVVKGAKSSQWLSVVDRIADRLCGSDTPLKQDRVRRKLWLSHKKG